MFFLVDRKDCWSRERLVKASFTAEEIQWNDTMRLNKELYYVCMKIRVRGTHGRPFTSD